MLHRRAALGLMLGGGMYARAALDRFFADAHGAAVLFDIRTRTVVAAHRREIVDRWLIPPGSTMKPLSLWALLDAGKLRAGERWPCQHKLTIAGRHLDCSHPVIAAPIDVSAAIAYSCNCFVAHYATRFERGELARFTAAHGLTAPAEMPAAEGDSDRQLQAIGEARALVTPRALLSAYTEVALRAPAPIRKGLEGAVEYGTAQLAASPAVKIAGKTGTVLDASGARVAWFAGFGPSHAPEAVVVVAVQGRSGGLDAAPVGGAILAEHLAKK